MKRTFSIFGGAWRLFSVTGAFYLTALFLFVSCGPRPINPHYLPDHETSTAPRVTLLPTERRQITDPLLQPFVDAYLEAAANSGLNLSDENAPVIFGDTSKRGRTVLAFCYFSRNGQNITVINEEKWQVADNLKRQVIVWHELGHCIQLRAHQNNYRTDVFRPVSLMYPFALKREYFSQDYTYYQWELFNQFLPSLDIPEIRANSLFDVVECDLTDYFN